MLWQRTLGKAEPDSIFSVQSISKTYSAVAIMASVADGTVDLDVPVSKYLPDFSVNSRFEDNPEQQITLRRLLSHTAGFTHEAPVGNNVNAVSPSFDAHVESISDTWLRYPVGARYSYSNLGLDLAAFVVQEASGIPFEEFVRSRLFLPLGLETSFVDTPEHNGNCKACISGNESAFSGLPDYIPLTASGGVRTTIGEAADFVRFFLNMGSTPGGVVLAPEKIHEMYRPHSAFSMRVFDLKEVYYGLGIYSFPEADTYAVGHDGGGFGYRASMKWYPEYGIGYALLMNSRDGEEEVWNVAWQLLEKLIETGEFERHPIGGVMSFDEFYASTPEEVESEAVAGEPVETLIAEITDWEDYAGTYRPAFGGGFELADPDGAPWGLIKVLAEDNLPHISTHSGDPVLLIKHKPGLFFSHPSGEALDFRGDQLTWRNIPLELIGRTTDG